MVTITRDPDPRIRSVVDLRHPDGIECYYCQETELGRSRIELYGPSAPPRNPKRRPKL